MKLFYLLSVLCLVACKQSGKDKEQVMPDVPDVETPAFISQFSELPADTLRVYSPDLQDRDDAFYGVPLDSTEVTSFPEPISPGPDNSTGFFACYSFPIDATTVGLIVRTPAMYVSSSVKLYLYDTTAQEVTSSMELAESWGDGGDAQEKEAFLLRSPENGVEVLLWDSQSHDNSIENPADKTMTTRDQYYRIKVTSQLDTLSTDGEILGARYKELLR